MRLGVVIILIVLPLLIGSAPASATSITWRIPQSRPMDDSSELWKLQQVLLQLAEEKLGPRDGSKKIYQPSFDSSGGPRIINTPGLDGAFAELSSNAEDYWPTAVYELAHETVHLLNPSVGQKATVLEEGLAVEFAVYAQVKLGLTPQMPRGGSYRSALQAVRRLAGSPLEVGRVIRQRRGSLKLATRGDLASADPLLAKQLLDRFQDDAQMTRQRGAKSSMRID